MIIKFSVKTRQLFQILYEIVNIYAELHFLSIVAKNFEELLGPSGKTPSLLDIESTAIQQHSDLNFI